MSEPGDCAGQAQLKLAAASQWALGWTSTLSGAASRRPVLSRDDPECRRRRRLRLLVLLSALLSQNHDEQRYQTWRYVVTCGAPGDFLPANFIQVLKILENNF